MNTRQNLHTHCTYCDGKNSIEEMILGAKAQGLTSLGFSSHGPDNLPYDESQMKAEDLTSYLSDITKYGQIHNFEVFKGLEIESRNADGLQYDKDPRLDYAIGSIHYYNHPDGSHYFVDWDVEKYHTALEAFGGEKPLMENYYTEVVEYSARSNYDITGHFDLPLKFERRTDMSFINKRWYRDLVLGAAEAVAANGKIFEVNTGAIARGYRDDVYPSEEILHLLMQTNTPIVISADAHAVANLTFAFEQTEGLLRRIGFKSQVALTPSGFKEASL